MVHRVAGLVARPYCVCVAITGRINPVDAVPSSMLDTRSPRSTYVWRACSRSSLTCSAVNCAPLGRTYALHE